MSLRMVYRLKIGKIYLLILLAILAAHMANAEELDPALFTYKSTVTVSGYTGSSTLTDFPVLVKLADGAPTGFDYGNCAADGSDLRFADPDGNLIPHEIESWNATGESYVWVKLPSLAGNDTKFTLYYGTNGVDVLPEVLAKNVWTRYAAVFHGGASIADATGKSATVTPQSVSAAASGGRAGGAMTKGSGKGFTFTNPVKSGALASIDNFSFSGWFKQSSGTTAILFSNKGRQEWNNNGFLALDQGGTYFSVGVGNGSNGVHQPAHPGNNKGALVIGTWSHVAFSYDKPKTTLESYFNGDNIFSTATARDILDPGKSVWALGGFFDNADNSFQGTMDELRIFNGTASADWLKAEYDSVADPTSFAVASPVASIQSPVFGDCGAAVSGNDITFSVRIDTLAAPASVTVFYRAEGAASFTELSLGTASVAGATLSDTVRGLGVGTYVWYAQAVSTISETDHTAQTLLRAFSVARAKDPAAACKRITATIAYDGAAAENVPVLLRLSESVIEDFHYSDITSSGFEFLDGDGNLLPYEIDTWDTNGTSLVWVLVPTFADGAELTIRYGTAFANPAFPASGVWSDYSGVWHLNETNSASAYGSYPNSTAVAGIDGEKAEASIADQGGKIGKSVKICDAAKKGSGYQLGGVFVPDSGTGSPLDLDGKFAISGWFKHKNQDYYYDKLFGKRKVANNSGEPNGAFAIEIGNDGSANNVSALGGANTTYTKVNFNSTLRNTWSYLTFVYDGAQLLIYQDGAYCNGFAINPATNNDAPLCFGNLTGGYGNGTGDSAWCGWIDEVRLAGRVPTANWIAAEYAAMANESVVSFSRVSVVDTATPVLAVPTFVRNQDGSFTITVGVSENVPASVACTLGGTDYPMSSSDLELPMSYSVTVSNLASGTYVPNVTAMSTTDHPVYSVCPTAFHAGALTVTKVSDADEGTLTPGVFRVARADADSTGLLEIPFDVEFSGDGLAVVVDPGVSTFTIPAGSAYVDVSLTPVYTTAVDEDKTITVLVSGAVVGQSSTATLTVFNADYDPSVRYVKTTGNDTNHGGTSELPKKTIGAAISSLANVAKSQVCTVHIAPGVYGIPSPLEVRAGIHVLGEDPDPSRTIVSNMYGSSNANQYKRVFTINHADAIVANLTMQKGEGYSSYSGGNFYIGSAGGMVSNCVVEAGYCRDNAVAAAAKLDAGIVTHTVFRKNRSGSGSANWSGNRPGVLDLNGSAHAENCLFVGNDQTSAVTMMNLNGTSVMRNCTIVDSSLSVTNAYCKSWSVLQIASGATVQNVIIAGVTNKVDGAPCRPTGTRANFINGALDSSIDGTSFPETTVVGTTEAFFNDYANGDYTLNPTGVLVNAGIDYDGMASVDLAGKKRKIGKHIDIGCYECQKTPGLFIFVR